MSARARKVLTALITGGVLAAGSGLSYADTVQYDGDGIDTSNSKNSKFALCSGAASHVDVFATINFTGTGNGAKHFANNGTVDITTSVAAEAADFITAAGGSVETANWDSEHDTVETAAMRLSVGTNWTAGTYKVTYTATGVDQDGKAYIDTDTNNVEITAATTGCSTTGGGDTGGGEARLRPRRTPLQSST